MPVVTPEKMKEALSADLKGTKDKDMVRAIQGILEIVSQDADYKIDEADLKSILKENGFRYSPMFLAEKVNTILRRKLGISILTFSGRMKSHRMFQLREYDA